MTDENHFWRSLEEKANRPEIEDLLHNEFPGYASQWTDSMNRRNFLQIMGAGLALVGTAGCTRQPLEKIIPFHRQPEGVIPGVPRYYATAMPWEGYGIGVLAESHEGRPTKMEGNPLHPASLGKTDSFVQASVLNLYNPDRLTTVLHRNQIATWESFSSELLAHFRDGGARVRFLSGTNYGPSLWRLWSVLQRKYPAAKWTQWEPAVPREALDGVRGVYGIAGHPVYHFDRAEVIVSLGSDFIASGPYHIRYIHDFSSKQAVEERSAPARLYVAESHMTLTGSKADHRLSVRESALPTLTVKMAQALAKGSAVDEPWVRSAVADLKRNRGKSIVVAGASQPASVHAAALLMNEMLGNLGRTIEILPEPQDSLKLLGLPQLVAEMNAGKVDTLVIFGGNPAFNAPADLDFAGAMQKVGYRAHLTASINETSLVSHWNIPESHFLESWSDCVAVDGTASIIQPLIAPLYASHTAEEIFHLAATGTSRKPHDIVQDTWKERWRGDFEERWQTALHHGAVDGTQAKPLSVRAKVTLDSIHVAPSKNAEYEVVMRADPTIYDGRFAGNGWLQELPKPFSKLTWDNAALVGPKLATSLKVETEDVISITVGGKKVELPVVVTPGVAEGTVAVTFGYGREEAGPVGSKKGVNTYPLRQLEHLWVVEGAQVAKTNRKYDLAITQHHHLMNGRNMIRAATFDEFVKNPGFANEEAHAPQSLYPPHKYEDHAWGMAINLNACVGCNTCMTACQAENNIPVVGKEQVSRGREMHWIRVDQYYSGEEENPEVFHQPVPCMHCENAPCEVVCPTNATVHSSEGLNEMVYNRCVGTRYCSNNCPYKVRRFNFLHFADDKTESLKPLRNPDVTVRSRGVMEKCTYCVQRINHARIEARKEGRPLRDGEIVTACQQACPANAIVFGDINDPKSQIAKVKANPLNYGILTDLNTRPRTTYLAVVTNPTAELTRKKDE